MEENKFSDLSMQLSIDVLKLVKELRAKHKTDEKLIGIIYRLSFENDVLSYSFIANNIPKEIDHAAI